MQILNNGRLSLGTGMRRGEKFPLHAAVRKGKIEDFELRAGLFPPSLVDVRNSRKGLVEEGVPYYSIEFLSFPPLYADNRVLQLKAARAKCATSRKRIPLFPNDDARS